MKPRMSIFEKSVILGFVIIFLIVVLPIVIPPIFQNRDHNHKPNCMTNQRQLALGSIMWSNENNETLPPAKDWLEAVGARGKILWCTTQGKYRKGMNSYAFNSAVAGKSFGELNKVATTTVLTADCKSTVTDNILRTPADFDPRHNGKVICSYVDGHVALMTVPATISLPSPTKKKEGK